MHKLLPSFLAAALAFACGTPVINVNVASNGTVTQAAEAEPAAEPSFDAAGQERTARHEGGHVVLLAYLYGPAALDRMEVYTVDKQKGGGLLGGKTYSVGRGTFQTKRDLLTGLAYIMGGREADLLMSGAVTTGGGQDLNDASESARNIQIAYGMGDTLLVRTRAEATPAQLDAAEADLQGAKACADAVISANRGVITALAALTMQQPEKDDTRTLSGDAFRNMLKTHPLQPVPAGTVVPDYCVMRPSP